MCVINNNSQSYRSAREGGKDEALINCKGSPEDLRAKRTDEVRACTAYRQPLAPEAASSRHSLGQYVTAWLSIVPAARIINSAFTL